MDDFSEGWDQLAAIVLTRLTETCAAHANQKKVFTAVVGRLLLPIAKLCLGMKGMVASQCVILFAKFKQHHALDDEELSLFGGAVSACCAYNQPPFWTGGGSQIRLFQF